MATPNWSGPWKPHGYVSAKIPDEIRFNVKYKCKHCKNSWKVKNTSQLKTTCNCTKVISAYKFEPIDTLVVYQCPNTKCGYKIKQERCESEIHEVPPCKMCSGMVAMEVIGAKYLWKKVKKFGEFRCGDCGRYWRSGNSWDGYGQDCKKCDYMILPNCLSKLKRPKFFKREERPPHQEELCDMCKKLGRNCQTYVSPDDAQTDEFDNIPLDKATESVITANSSIITGDDDEDSRHDGCSTPVNSDDDSDIGNIKEVEEMLQDLMLNKDH